MDTSHRLKTQTVKLLSRGKSWGLIGLCLWMLPQSPMLGSQFPMALRSSESQHPGQTQILPIVQGRSHDIHSPDPVQGLGLRWPTQLAEGHSRWGPRPKRRRSGGNRDLCQSPLVAIVPGDGAVSLDLENCGGESFATPSTTAMRSPIIWFYIPKISHPQLTGRLTLFKDGQLIHQSIRSISSTGAILPIAFNYELDPNVAYDWQFSLLVEPDHPTENPTVENTIQYIPPKESLAINRSNFATLEHPQDQLHDAAQAFCHNPENQAINQKWLQQLQGVELESLYLSPMIECQTIASEKINPAR